VKNGAKISDNAISYAAHKGHENIADYLNSVNNRN